MLNASPLVSDLAHRLFCWWSGYAAALQRFSLTVSSWGYREMPLRCWILCWCVSPSVSYKQDIHFVNCNWVYSYEVRTQILPCHCVCAERICQGSAPCGLFTTELFIFRWASVLVKFVHVTKERMNPISVGVVSANLMHVLSGFLSSTRMLLLLKFCPRTASSQTRIPHRYYIYNTNRPPIH